MEHGFYHVVSDVNDAEGNLLGHHDRHQQDEYAEDREVVDEEPPPDHLRDRYRVELFRHLTTTSGHSARI